MCNLFSENTQRRILNKQILLKILIMIMIALTLVVMISMSVVLTIRKMNEGKLFIAAWNMCRHILYVIVSYPNKEVLQMKI